MVPDRKLELKIEGPLWISKEGLVEIWIRIGHRTLLKHSNKNQQWVERLLSSYTNLEGNN